MQTKKRRPEPSVIQRLLDEPYRFQFAQAVRVLLMWLCQNNVSTDKALTPTRQSRIFPTVLALPVLYGSTVTPSICSTAASSLAAKGTTWALVEVSDPALSTAR
jgi:hypothetical protein